MYIYDYYGEALTQQKIIPGNTVKSLSPNCYYYKRWKLNFDNGSDEILENDWIVGATSGAVGRVVSITTIGGDWGAGNDAYGYMIIDSKVGLFQDNENIKVGSDSTTAIVNEPIFGDAQELMYDYPYRGMIARCAQIGTFDNTALVDWTGAKPDQTSKIGTYLVANSYLPLKDINGIRNFKCIDLIPGSASILQIKYFF